MALNLNKQQSSINTIATATPYDPQQALREAVASRVFDGYCDTALRNEIIRHGSANLGLDLHQATMIVDMELDVTQNANEQRLIDELDSLLRRFTDRDKKLDAKERSDAVQMVCKPKANFAKGLLYKVAEDHIEVFCRTNRVKVKVGIFRWEIP